MYKFNLQYFADYINITGAPGTTDNTVIDNYDGSRKGNKLSIGMKEFYDTQLLENVRPDLYFAQFAKETDLPANNGKIVEWRKWNTLPKALEPLKEGVTPDGSQLGQTRVTAEVRQYGDFVRISDVIDLTHTDDTLMGANEELGAQASETRDTLTRDVVSTGYWDMMAPIVSGGSTTTVDYRHQLTADAKLTPTLVNKAATHLKKHKVPKINGKYYAIIHPSVAEDLRESAAWIDVHKYDATEQIFNGEIGELHGVRFVETTEAKVRKGENLDGENATLTLDTTAAVTSASSSIGFTSTGTVAASALVGREIVLTAGDNTYHCLITANTSSTFDISTTAVGMDHAISAAKDASVTIYPGEGGAAGVATYDCIFFGKDAWGKVKLKGGIEMIVHALGSGGSTDPLNQRQTAGWKMFDATALLYEERLLRVEVGSSYSSIDEAN